MPSLDASVRGGGIVDDDGVGDTLSSGDGEVAMVVAGDGYTVAVRTMVEGVTLKSVKKVDEDWGVNVCEVEGLNIVVEEDEGDGVTGGVDVPGGVIVIT